MPVGWSQPHGVQCRDINDTTTNPFLEDTENKQMLSGNLNKTPITE